MNSIMKHRKRLQLSQAEIGKRLGVRQQTICKWENGLSEPSLSQGLLLAKIFNVEVEELLPQPQEAELV